MQVIHWQLMTHNSHHKLKVPTARWWGGAAVDGLRVLASPKPQHHPNLSF